MSDVLDPTRKARRQARAQAAELQKEKQTQLLAKAEAESDVAAVKSRATGVSKGRRSLISGTQTKRENLG